MWSSLETNYFIDLTQTVLHFTSIDLEFAAFYQWTSSYYWEENSSSLLAADYSVRAALNIWGISSGKFPNFLQCATCKGGFSIWWEMRRKSIWSECTQPYSINRLKPVGYWEIKKLNCTAIRLYFIPSAARANLPKRIDALKQVGCEVQKALKYMQINSHSFYFIGQQVEAVEHTVDTASPCCSLQVQICRKN